MMWIELIATAVAFAADAAVQDAETQSVPAPAVQGPPPETVVTARKRNEALLDVPVSVSVFTAEEIEKGGMRSMRDVSMLTPNMNMVEFTARRLSFPFIRGIGSGIGEAGVVTYVDGVQQLTTGSTNLPLRGLERVEILRGPQGSVYGRNALGGVIKLQSKAPSSTPEFSASAGVGNYDLYEAAASWSGPVGQGGSALGLDASYMQRDGYTKNVFTGDQVDTRESFFGRAQYLMNPSDDSELRVGLYGETARDGGFALSFLQGLKQDPWRIDQDFEGKVNRDIVAPSVTYHLFGDSVDFRSITSYQDWDVLETSDFDFTPLDLIRRKSTEDQSYLYQELLWSSPDSQVGDGDTLSWIAGLQGFIAGSSRSAENEFRPLFPTPGTDTSSGDFDDYGIGVFGQLSAAVTEAVELTAGLRYDHEFKEASLRSTFVSGGVTLVDNRTKEDADFGQLLPSFAATWKVRDDTSLYGSVAKGYKAGGFNLRAPTNQIAFDPEHNWSFEVGVKSALAGGRVALRLAAFYIDWDDMQLSLFDPVAGGYITNASQSTSQGVEAEARTQVTEMLSLFGTVGTADTEFGDFVDPYGNQVSGNSLPFAPEYTFSLGAQLDGDLPREMGWFARAEWVGVGNFYYNANNTESESYDLVNLRAGFDRKGWELSFWVRNLFDTAYFPIAFQPDPSDETVFVAETGEPMVGGVSLRATF